MNTSDTIAALAEAVGLLRELRASLDGQGYIRLNTPGSEQEWLDRRDAFIAKHAPRLRPTATPGA